MDQRNQPVRLAAAKGRAKAEDGGDFARCPTQSRAYVCQQALESAGGISLAEEEVRLAIFFGRGAFDYLGQVGSKIRTRDLTFDHVLSRLAEVEDGLQSVLPRPHLVAHHHAKAEAQRSFLTSFYQRCLPQTNRFDSAARMEMRARSGKAAPKCSPNLHRYGARRLSASYS